jgi:hypothetical protein
LTAFEVAEFVGCHEETVRRAYLRGLLTSLRFGVRAPVSSGRRARPDQARRTNSSLVTTKKPTDVNVEIATMHHVLETLRAAMNWVHGPDATAVQPVAVPPVRRPLEQEKRRREIVGSPGTRRIRLLETGLQKMNTAEHIDANEASVNLHLRVFQGNQQVLHLGGRSRLAGWRRYLSRW